MSTISIVLRKDKKANKKGEFPIHFRIIKNRKVTYISTSYFVLENLWDNKFSRVKKGYPNSARVNSIIHNRFNELQDQVYEYDSKNKTGTTRQLKEKIFGRQQEDFFSFAQNEVEKYRLNGQISTYITHRSTINTLREYEQNKSLSFQDITVEYLAKYEQYLKSKSIPKGNKIHIKPLMQNTVHKHLKFLRKLFNDAYRMDKIEYQHNPFPKYKLKLEKTSRSYLTEVEVDMIGNVKTVLGERMDLHKDMFIFACYAGGLRISDVLKLKWKNFDGSHLTLQIHKTKANHTFKLPNRALDILLKYKSDLSLKENYVFPILDNNLDEKNAKELYSAISSATAYINKNLKLIAQKANIEKPLSFHISRHTFGTLALTKGMAIEKVSKVLAHSQLRETQIYAKIISSELDNAMDLFN